MSLRTEYGATEVSVTVDPHDGVASTLNTNSSSSRIVIRTEFGVPAVTDDGSVPSATVNVSFSVSGSWFVVIVPVPLVELAAIVMLASGPWSSGSAVSFVSVSGIVTLLDRARDSVAVTVTDEPSSTRFGEAESDTVGGTCAACRRVTVTV